MICITICAPGRYELRITPGEGAYIEEELHSVGIGYNIVGTWSPMGPTGPSPQNVVIGAYAPVSAGGRLSSGNSNVAIGSATMGSTIRHTAQWDTPSVRIRLHKGNVPEDIWVVGHKPGILNETYYAIITY